MAPRTNYSSANSAASDFIFRVKDGAKLALFEADGGAWKIEAMRLIASWIINRLGTSEVTALNSIPVIS